MFIVVVDAHSKWLDVAVVTTPSSQQAIKILRNLFATHGLPEMVVSDNGSAFTSAEFQTFVKRNGIRHVRSAPYHPSSNGQAELESGPDLQGGHFENHWRSGCKAGQISISVSAYTTHNNWTFPCGDVVGSAATISPGPFASRHLTQGDSKTGAAEGSS